MMRFRMMQAIGLATVAISVTPGCADSTTTQSTQASHLGAAQSQSASQEHRYAKLKLKILIGADGRAHQVTVIKSSGYKDLDNAAIEAVKSWRFKPALRDGRPVPGYAIQPFSFQLPDDAKSKN